jgi:predicted enzyme related to lactoylglutathione lyase
VGERTSYAPGTFCWVDLGVPDVDAGKAFYGAVLGWTTEDMPSAAGTYTMCRAGEHVVAALFSESDLPLGVPLWNNYVTVDDAGAALARAAELGASAQTEAFDVEDAGRMATLEDPEGARLYLWEPRGMHGAALVNAPGALVWNELGTRDPEAAQRFYGALFDWTFETGGELDTGGTEYVTIRNGDPLNGGIRRITEMEGDTPAHWLPTFGVADLDPSVGAVGEAGGHVLFGPVDVGPGRIAVIKDSQRTSLTLYDGRFDP